MWLNIGAVHSWILWKRRFEVRLRMECRWCGIRRHKLSLSLYIYICNYMYICSTFRVPPHPPCHGGSHNPSTAPPPCGMGGPCGNGWGHPTSDQQQQCDWDETSWCLLHLKQQTQHGPYISITQAKNSWYHGNLRAAHPPNAMFPPTNKALLRDYC